MDLLFKARFTYFIFFRLYCDLDWLLYQAECRNTHLDTVL